MEGTREACCVVSTEQESYSSLQGRQQLTKTHTNPHYLVPDWKYWILLFITSLSDAHYDNCQMLWYFFLLGKSCICGWDIIFPWVCLYELQPVLLPRELCQCNAWLCKFCLGPHMLCVTRPGRLPGVKWWDCYLLHVIFSLPFFPKVNFVLFLFSVSFKIIITFSVHCSVYIYVTHSQSRRYWALCLG